MIESGASKHNGHRFSSSFIEMTVIVSYFTEHRSSIYFSGTYTSEQFVIPHQLPLLIAAIPQMENKQIVYMNLLILCSL